MTKYIDFDRYLAEKNNEEVIIKAFGRELKLPSEPRASVVVTLKSMRDKEGDDADIPAGQVLEICEATIGKEEMNSLLEEGISIVDLEWLMAKIWEVYTPQKGDGEAKND